MWLLLACETPPAPLPAGPLPRAGLDVGAASLAWRALDALEGATFQFPASNTPASFDGVFRLEGPWEETGRRYARLKGYATPLPFPCDMPRPNYAPLGARLYRGGEEVPFAAGMQQGAGPGWFIEEGTLHVLAIEPPSAGSLELRVAELAATLRARNHGDAGVPDTTFASVEATVGRVTRPALYVPAPGSVSFQVDVPEGARLDLGAALLPDPLRGADAGDGAAARVEVDGKVVWQASLEPGEDFVDAVVDLPAGRRTLTFRSDPAGTSDYDYVVFSAPTVRRPPARPPRQVLVVGIDTLRWDALGVNGRGPEASPELDAWTKDAVVFDNARAPAPRTRPSFRTALTGRYPLDALSAQQTAAVLAAHGFRTAGFAANVHLVPRFGFNEGFEHWYYENGARAGDQVERALAWMTAHADEDWYVFVHLMDPHTFYNAPLPWGARFTKGRSPAALPAVYDRWHVELAMRRKQLTDEDRQLVRAAYDGEVAYLSHALDRLLRAPGRRLTVVHSDHGEEFWDHDGFEHNHSLYDELVKAVFFIRPPDGWGGGPHRVAAPVGLQDLAPTLLDLLAIPEADRPPTDGTSLRPFVDADRQAEAPALEAALAARPLYQGHLMFDTERWSVVYEGHKYVLHTGSGREELYDLQADPGERTPLPADHPRLPTMIAALSRATGWPVGEGWRLHLRQDGGPPWELRFDAPIAAAGVIDPEALRPVRANLEWGEHPPALPGDVGRVLVSPDATTVRFEPGRKASGQVVWVRCATTCPAGTFTAGPTTRPLAPGENRLGPSLLIAEPGRIIEVQRTEGDVLGAVSDSDQLEALRELGYLDGDHRR